MMHEVTWKLGMRLDLRGRQGTWRGGGSSHNSPMGRECSYFVIGVDTRRRSSATGPHSH
jgi:hypothetical protein